MPPPPKCPATPEQDNSGDHRAHYETILTDAALDDWIARLNAAPAFALDTETTGLNAMQAELVGISFATEAGVAAYLPLAHHYAGAPEQLDRDATLAKLKPLLENPAPKIIGQHLKYDRHIFANYGITLGGIEHSGVLDDTLLQSYVLEAHQSHELGSLTTRHVGPGDDQLRRRHRQGRVAHRLRAGGDRARQRIRG